MAARDVEAAYAALIERARTDPTVVGVVAFGSRAVGVDVSEASDVDCFVIVHGDPDAWRPWQTPHGSPVEVWATTLDGFRTHGLHGTPTWWNRPSLLRARVDLDKLDGEIARIVEARRRLGPEEAATVAEGALGDALNAIYRALKTVERGRRLAARLDAAEAIPPLLTAAFALEGRVRPWNKWLELELDREPLVTPAFAGLLDLVNGSRDRPVAGSPPCRIPDARGRCPARRPRRPRRWMGAGRRLVARRRRDSGLAPGEPATRAAHSSSVGVRYS